MLSGNAKEFIYYWKENGVELQYKETDEGCISIYQDARLVNSKTSCKSVILFRGENIVEIAIIVVSGKNLSSNVRLLKLVNEINSKICFDRFIILQDVVIADHNIIVNNNFNIEVITDAYFLLIQTLDEYYHPLMKAI